MDEIFCLSFLGRSWEMLAGPQSADPDRWECGVNPCPDACRGCIHRAIEICYGGGRPGCQALVAWELVIHIWAPQGLSWAEGIRS